MSELCFKDGVMNTTYQNINDLVSGKSVQLRVEAQEQFFESDEDDDYDELDMGKYEEACEKWKNADFVGMTFEEIRQTMVKIDLGIYKQVLLEGFGEPIPEKNCRVTMVYSVFFEKTPIPVDSTLLTGKNFSFITGEDSGLLVGIHHSVMTMKAQEQAKFIIPCKYLYGELGCPPRIPPNTDGLVLIRVINLEPGYGDHQVQDNETMSYSSVMKKVEELRQKGKNAVKCYRFSSAVRTYHEAIRILVRVDTQNPEEDRERNDLVVKMLINSAMMYNKLNQPKSACSNLNEAQRYFPNVPTDLKGKLFLHKGRALRNLGEFDRAKSCLHEAQKYSNAPEIRKEMELVVKEKDKYDTAMASMMQKAFNLHDKVQKNNLSKINREFEAAFKETVQNFLKDENIKKQIVAVDFTKEQKKIVDDVLLMVPNVILSVLPTEHSTKYCLVKTD
ncbi:inactive peptidyl-prolyl cis-trans isomerase shutdown [Lutzomyia longipalpis]|uniref:peptidylprolyl isomerase n=1 Tax=Lutzomyia longipalpis TaxID=7200 RepID=A0A1B0EW84_LUTLO|nr:inactive peptidyl-prolyl cis-trans isomerase shutdown [Lutzomyia longipalpis]